MELSDYFTDPDGDPLTYTAVPFWEDRVRVTVLGSVLTLEGLEGGRNSITGHGARSGRPGGLPADLSDRHPAEPAAGGHGDDPR